MGRLKTLITGLALTYALGGCATSGALEHKRDAELDALLAETAPASLYIQAPEVKPVKTSAAAPRESTIEGYGRVEADIFITPEKKVAAATAIDSKIQEMEVEVKADEDKRYQTCKEDLRYQLPPGTTARCEGTEGDKYIDCAFNIDGRVYAVKVETEAVSRGGAQVAYQKLVAKRPRLLEKIAREHCTLKTHGFEFEEDEVIGQTGQKTLDYVVGEAA
jgi:hypothetical protein